ncbi:MAG TPA: septum formation initiator family protein [Bryobacteraceae bacterium]|nr:septum formation initiator family protein [Bryobacteraceae bacterium]
METRRGDWFQSGLPARRRRVLGIFLGVAILTAYAVTALRGPQGVEVLVEKYREIRKLEAHNAAAAVENERRKERIERLRSSPSEQEMEIRKQLKLLRPGETTFILPDAPKSPAPAEQP